MTNYTDGNLAKKITDISEYKETVAEKKEQEKPHKEYYRANYKKNEKQEVFPFRSQEDLDAMHNYFVEHKQDRNDLMFIVGINIGLRASDLLELKWKHVIDEDGEIRDTVEEGVTVQEKKTKKFRTFYLNESCKTALSSYYEKHQPKMTDYIFASQKGGHLEVKPACNILKTAAKACGIKYNVGTHSLRKTFGYHQIKAHPNDSMFICQLQKMFGHTSPEVTLRYCGLENEQLRQYYNDVNLL